MKPRTLYIIVWLLPAAYWALNLGFALYLSHASPDCIINEGFARGCILFGADVSDAAYNAGMYISWGLIFFVIPWTILGAIIGSILLMISIGRKSRQEETPDA